MSLLIAVPTGIKMFNWIGTMWRGEVWFSTAMLMAVGLSHHVPHWRALTGIYLASPPLDFFTHDTYFVVAHFHSIVMALVMGAMGGLYYWGPKITGYLLNETIGKIQFWTLFIGTQVFTLPMYLLGLRGMPRRIAIYPEHASWQFLNEVSTVGAVIVGISTIAFVVNVAYSWKKYPAGDNPWDGHTLEWVHHLTATAPQLLPLAPDSLRASDVGITTTPTT